MNFPTPRIPTDNLYKFAAITGLIVFVVAWVTPLLVSERLATATRKADAQVALLNLRAGADSLRIEILELRERRTNPVAFEEELESLRKSIDSTRREEILANERLAEVKWMSKDADRIWVVAASFMLTGILLAVLGFRLWYYRLQKPLDEWVAVQVERLRAERLPLSGTVTLTPTPTGPPDGGSTQDAP